MYYIFRKSDGVLLYAPNRAEQLINAQSACLANEGGVEDDYATVEVDVSRTPEGQVPALQADGTVTFEPNPLRVAREVINQSAKEKLNALGLTDEEVSAIVRG